MKIVFATRMGNTDELVRQKLGYTDAIQIVDGSEKVDGDYVLFTYTDGYGEVPGVVESFLDNNKAGLKGVVATGSMARHADTFAVAGDKIVKDFGGVLIAKVDVQGTEEDHAKIKSAIAALQRKENIGTPMFYSLQSLTIVSSSMPSMETSMSSSREVGTFLPTKSGRIGNSR